MDAFFELENHACSPSLATNGIMHHAANPTWWNAWSLWYRNRDIVPDVDVKIVDDAALVHIVDPKKSQVSVNIKILP